MKRLPVVAFLAGLFLLWPALANATTRTWTGGGGDNNWGTAGNWGGTAPVAGDDLVFPSGASKLSNNNNITAATSFNSITISGSGYTLAGNSITLAAGNVTDSTTSGSSTISLAIVMAATRTYTVTNAAETLTISGVISGAAGVTMSGSGTLILSGTNTYTGVTTISSGSTLIAAANTALGTIAGATTITSGGTLGFQGSITYSTVEPVTVNGAGVGSAGAILNVSGTNSFAGALTSGSARTFGSNAGTLTLSGSFSNAGFLLTVTGAGNTKLTGLLSGTGGLTKNDAGTLTIGAGNGAPNTYTGTTTVNAGELDLNMASKSDAFAGPLVIGDGVHTSIVKLLELKQWTSITNVTINSLGTLDLNNFDQDKIVITMVGGSLTTGTGLLTLAGDIDVNASSTMATIIGVLPIAADRTITVADGSADPDISIPAVVSLSHDVIKAGAGRMVFSAANTITAAITITAGQLQIQNADAISTANSTTVSSGAALELSGGISFTAGPVTLNGNGVGGTGALLNVSGTNTFPGGITIGSATTFGSTAGTMTVSDAFANAGFALTSTGAGNATLSGIISGTGAFTKTGSGTTTLSAVNSYTGLTTVNAGTLLVNGSLAAGTTATLDGGTLGGSGTVRTISVTATGGTLSPGSPASSPGTLNATNTTLNSASTYTVQLNSTTAGTGYDVLSVTGTVALASSTVSVSLGFTPGIGNTFQIITNDGADTVTGTFSGLAEGASLTVGSVIMSISYVGGTGNDVVLTVTGAIRTWTGASSNLWNVAGNWQENAVPTATMDLVFPSGAANLSNSNNITAGTSFNSITISGSGYILAGNSITLAGNLSDTTSSGASTISLAISMSATRTFSISNSGETLTISGVLSGAGGLTKTNAGKLALSGTNTYTGVTTHNGGTISVAADTNLGAAPGSATPGQLTFGGGTLNTTATFTMSSNRGIAFTSTGTIDVASSTTLTYGGIAAGAGGLIKTSAGTLTLSGVNTFTGATTITSGVVSISTGTNLGAVPGSPTPGQLTFGGGTLATTATFTMSSNRGIAFTSTGTIDVASSTTLTYGGIAAGAGGLTKTSAGTLTLSGVNTFTGATTINAGVVSISTGTNLGAVPGSPTPGQLTFGGGTLATTATFTLDSNRGVAFTSTGTIDVASSTSLTYGGIAAGAGGLTKTSAGTLTLSGSHTYTGATTINAGLVSIAADNNLGAAPGSATAGQLTFGGGTLATTATFTLSSNRGIAFTSTGIMDVASSTTLTYGGIAAGAGGLTKTSAGTLTLSGANIYTGTTTISVGVVNAQNATALGTTAAGTSITSGARLELQGTIAVGAETLTINGTGGGTGALLNVSDSNSWAGAITLGAASSIGSTAGTLTATGGITNGGFLVTMAGAGNLTISTTAIAGTGGLTKTDAGTLTLSVANSFTGVTTINGGVVSVAADNHLGTAPGSPTAGQLTFEGGTLTTTAAFTLNSNRGIAFTSTGTFSVASSTTLTYGGIAAGTGGLTKTSAGTLTLSGTNTYSGTTTVSAGSVLVNGSQTSSTVSLNGGTLGGTGTVGAITSTASGGSVAPGSSGPGLFNSGNVDLSASASRGVAVELNSTTAGSGYDQLVVTGTVNLTGATLSGTVGFTPALGNTFTIINNDGADAVTGTFTGLAEGSSVSLSGYDFTVSYNAGTGNDVVLTSAAAAAILTWNGGGGNNNWTTAANWVGGVAPVAGNSLVFDSTGVGARPSPNNDFAAATSFWAITVSVGGYTIGGNSVDLTSDLTASNASGSSTVSLVVGGAATLTKSGAGTLTLSGANTYSGATSINAGVVSVAADNNLGAAPVSALAGQLIFGGGTLATTATFTMNSNRGVAFTSTGTIDVAGSTTLTYGGIAAGAGGLTKTSAGTLTLSGATVTIGDFTLTSGTVVAPSANTFAVAGNWSNSGTFTHNSGSATFNGVSPQSIGGSVSTTFNNFTLNNSNGITLSKDATVNGTLTFTSGKVTTGSNTVYISSGGSVSRSSGHVVGNFKKYIATGATIAAFEVGDASNYTPAGVSFASVTAAGDLTTTTTSSDHPNIGSSTITSTKSVNRHWTMTNSGITFTTYGATFSFVGGDVDVSADTNIFNIGRYASGTWSYPTIGSRTSTSTEATGLTAFGDFQIGEGGPPSVVLFKSVSPSGTQPPSTDLAYTVTYTNSGSSSALSFVVTDPIPAHTDFKIGSIAGSLGTTGLSVAITYSNDGGSTWTYTPASGGGGAPAGYDRNVTTIRWTYTGNLGQASPNNSGSVGFTARIR